MQRTHALIAILALSTLACDRSAAARAADGQAAQKAPPVYADVLGAAAEAEASLAGTQVTGTVVETMNAASYTYVRLKTASGEAWAAVTQTELSNGAEVTIGNGNWMEGFESKTLNRRFDRILFGSLVGPGGPVTLPAGHPATTGAQGSAETAEAPDAKVEKAPGKDARTVAEIHASMKAIKGSEVVVRGKVVKWNADILGRNWVHLRDGSGSAEKGDNDLAVTTAEIVAKGDVVTFRGKIALDKDFTAGYVYPLLLEDAKVVK